MAEQTNGVKVLASVFLAFLLATGCRVVGVAPSSGRSVAPVWRNLGPGGGGWIQSICASPHAANDLFVGCDVGGIYFSDSCGDSYTIYNTGLEDYFVECIVPHPTNPDTIYLGCESGVCKSTDHGRNWRWLRKGFPPPRRYSYSTPIGALVVDPRSSDTLYAGIGRPRRFEAGQGAVYRSTDGGELWIQINAAGSLPQDAVITDIVIDLLDSSALMLASSAGVYRSDDACRSWRRVSETFAVADPKRLVVSGREARLYVTSRNKKVGNEVVAGGVFRSDDEGVTWEQVLPDDFVQGLAVDPDDPDVVFAAPTDHPYHDACTGDGLLMTRDGGKHWVSLNTDRFTCKRINCMALVPGDPARIYIGTAGNAVLFARITAKDWLRLAAWQP